MSRENEMNVNSKIYKEHIHSFWTTATRTVFARRFRSRDFRPRPRSLERTFQKRQVGWVHVRAVAVQFQFQKSAFVYEMRDEIQVTLERREKRERMRVNERENESEAEKKPFAYRKEQIFTSIDFPSYLAKFFFRRNRKQLHTISSLSNFHTPSTKLFVENSKFGKDNFHFWFFFLLSKFLFQH